MQTTRESFYRCVFTSLNSRRVAHVRAWDSDEAMQLFKAELRTEGIRERGKFQVERLGGSEEEHRGEIA